MKSTTALLAFFFFFLLFAFTTTAEVVLDSDGDMLRNGGQYYLSSPEPYGGPVITSAAIRKGESDACSLAVVQAFYTNGWATSITALVRPTFISTSFALYLSFAYLPPNICTNSSDWVVIRSSYDKNLVMVGDAKEFGDAVVRGWFYIKPYDHEKRYYKLVFCHGENECGNIGVHIDSEKRRRLAVTDGKPLVFKFDKVINDRLASDLSMVV